MKLELGNILKDKFPFYGLGLALSAQLNTKLVIIGLGE
jgi:hypothetical protein